MNKKRIVCFGDSNTWCYDAVSGGRFDDDQRWTFFLAQRLGDEYSVVEEGLSGRTTVFDDPLNPGLSGFSVIDPIFLSHFPLDMVVIMLGTNDCKERFSANVVNITDGLRCCVNKIKGMDIWRKNPAILIVAPIIIDECIYTTDYINGEMGKGCVEKSSQLPPLFKKLASDLGCYYLDANDFARCDTVDYMHFDKDSNEPFGYGVADLIRTVI